MHIGIVVLSWGASGSEKRFANLYNYLKLHSANHYTLVLNHCLYHKLADAGIVLDRQGIRLLANSGLSKALDQPVPDLKRLLRVSIPGPNYLAHRLYENLHSLSIRLSARSASLSDFDVVHYVFPYYAEHLGPARARVLSCQDTNLKRTLLRNRFFGTALHSDGYFDIASKRIKELLVAETGVSDDRRLQVNPCSFIDYTKTYMAPKEPLVAFVGRLDANKNPLLFVDAVRLVRQVHPEVKAIIYGAGPLREKVAKRVADYDLQDTLTLEFNPKPQATLARASVFVSIQNGDNYHSQALMEAMASGCAIVASEVGETPRLVSDDVGFRVGLDADAIANRISWLLEHPSVANEMGQYARRKVMSEQTIERFVAYIERLYDVAARPG